MKKSFIIISLLSLCIGTSISAQDSVKVKEPNSSFRIVEFGVRFMPTLSSVLMDASSGGTVKGEATFGIGVGALLGFNLTKHIGVEADVIYNSLSQKYTDEGLDRVMKVRYLNIPLMFSLNTGNSNPVNLKVEFGPAIGVNLATSITSSGDTLTTVLTTKQTDVGVAYGAGLEFLLNTSRTIRLDAGYRGVYGYKVKTNSAYVGFTFLF
jgi:opacity protein-like surface antigen